MRTAHRLVTRHGKGVTGFPITPEFLERPTGFELATSSLGSWHSATELRPPGAPYLTTIRSALFPILERHGVGLEHFVAPRLPVEPLAHSVEVDLLVERHRRHLVDPELVDPV